jgi:hypothetical protein
MQSCGIAPVPEQSAALAASGITPSAVNSGAASLHAIAIAQADSDDYFRDVKRWKQDLVPTATARDVSAAVFLATVFNVIKFTIDI